ncbi:MAG: metal-dependent transcriptional regulator [Firmicutes bacterium]|nr:metal-dependent transcriptional regulator [Bacillota bacterium]
MLSPSKKKYLLTIYELSRSGERLRVTRIAGALRVSKPSVCRMVQSLAEEGLLAREEGGKIALTRAGEDTCCELHRQYLALCRFFRAGGCGEEVAISDASACLMLSEEGLDALLAAVGSAAAGTE